jgi:hypothetical protein
MGYSGVVRTAGSLTAVRGIASPTAGVSEVEGRSMKLLKSQAIRVLLALSALASSALVLEAGKRWGF